MNFKKIIVALLFFMGSIEKGYSMGWHDSFDPEKTAQCETNVWKAYYAKELRGASVHLKSMLEQVYAMPDATNALHLNLKVVGAFAQMPQDASKEQYKTMILPLLTAALEEIKKTSTYSSFNAEILAEKELEWWVARRIPAELDTDNVGAIMAQTYAFQYGGEASVYGRAAFLRASAARYRDKCQDEYGGVKDYDWDVIQGMLVHSYTLLKSVLSGMYPE